MSDYEKDDDLVHKLCNGGASFNKAHSSAERKEIIEAMQRGEPDSFFKQARFHNKIPE